MRPVHLKIVQGTPFEVLVSVKQRDEADELVPMPLTNCVVRLQARASKLSSSTLLDLVSPTNITVDEEAGQFTIRLSSKETSELSWPTDAATGDRVPFQCEVQRPDEEDFRALEGT